nr:hypothetical protein [Tanacetum cinerariifolium]
MIIIMVTILKPLTLHYQFLLQHNKSLILFHPSNSYPKKGGYDIWAMKMKHYLSHTDYPIWQVIQNGNGPVLVTIDTNEIIKVLPLKTAEEVMARERERKARTTLLMPLLEDHLEKFHKMADAKEMWEAIKSRFGYDRFQTLLSQLEILGVGVSHKDVNQKFLRSLPSSWSQVALIIRTKPGLDTLNFNDLYNTLRVFERDVKGTTASSSNTQNVAFVSGDNTSSTNDVSTTYSVSSPSVSKSHKEGSSSYTDEVIHSFFANKSNSPQLDYDYLKQINDDDMEEMDLKWQVAMISIRIKKFHKRIGRTLQFDTKDPVGFDKTKVDYFNCHKIRHFARDYRAKGKKDSRRRDVGYNGNKTRDNGRRPAYKDDSKALVTINEEDIDWSGHVEEDTQNYAKMAYSSSNSGSDNKSVFMNNASNLEDTSINDRYADGMHAVPPPMTWNYMPSRLDVEIDYSKFTYGLKQTSVDESDSKTSEYASCESDSSVETITSMPEPVENAPWDDPHRALNDKGIIDSRCSRHMTGNKFYLVDYQEFKGDYVAFGGSNGRITGKGKIKAVSTNLLNTVSTPFSTAGPSRAFNDGKLPYPDDPSMPHLEDIYASLSERIFTDSSYDGKGVVTDFNNLETTVNVSPTPTTRIHTVHPKTYILRDHMSAIQTRSKVNKNSEAHALLISQALEDESWVDVMQEELLQFQIQKVWILVDFPFGKKAIETKWVYRNKKDERGVVVRNKARLVAYGHRIFLAFSSYMGFIVYQMDMKSAFLYGTIDEEVYVSQPPGFVDFKFPNKVYKVVKALYGLHQAPRAWYATLSTFLEKSRYRRGVIDNTLFIKQDKKDIMLVQVYVDDIIFGSTKKSWCDEFEELMKNSVKTASTPTETQKPLVKDEEVADVDVHLYRSMTGSLMYLTASRPDIMFAVCACSRFQVTPKTSHLQDVKRMFRKSTTGGCQFLVGRLSHGNAKSKLLWLLLLRGRIYHDSSQDPRVDIEGTGGSRGDQVNLPHYSPLSGGHTSDRAEGSLNLEALDALCTNLSNMVLALETVKDAQAKEILTLKAKSWKRGPTKDGSDKLDAKLDEDMEYIDTEEALNEGRQELTTAGPTTTSTTLKIFNNEEMTLADTLIKLKDDKAKVVAFKDLESTDRPAIDPKDKRKGVLEEPESAKKMTKSDFDAAHIARDKEIARQLEVKLQAELERERQRDEQASMDYIANLYDEVQERIDVDHELAEEKAISRRKSCCYQKQASNQNSIRRLMMTNLKNIDIVPIGSKEDKRMIRDMNKKAEEEKDGTEIHMLAERMYPLTTRILERMLSLRLIVESASDAAYDLLRFIQKQIDESGGHDRGEKDL